MAVIGQRRIRDALAAGSALAHSGRNYSTALRILQGALGSPATSRMISKRRFSALIADGYDSFGHVTRELGRSRRWAAEFHQRAALLWGQAEDFDAAALSRLSAAHCLESIDTRTALGMIQVVRESPIYNANSTIHMQTDNRHAETLALIGDSASATRMSRGLVVPFIEWNEVHPEWAAISLIAAAKFSLRTNGPDLAFELLTFARSMFSVGISANDVILTDLLGVEVAALAASGDVDEAERVFKQMSILCSRNSYPIREHVEPGLIERLDLLD